MNKSILVLLFSFIIFDMMFLGPYYYKPQYAEAKGSKSFYNLTFDGQQWHVKKLKSETTQTNQVNCDIDKYNKDCNSNNNTNCNMDKYSKDCNISNNQPNTKTMIIQTCSYRTCTVKIITVETIGGSEFIVPNPHPTIHENCSGGSKGAARYCTFVVQ